jgi:hypothetical protein
VTADNIFSRSNAYTPKYNEQEVRLPDYRKGVHELDVVAAFFDPSHRRREGMSNKGGSSSSGGSSGSSGSGAAEVPAMRERGRKGKITLEQDRW